MIKKKIFLGGYINHINAQNINCKSIATHLDKDKYNVKTLVLGNKNIPEIKGVNYYKVSSFLYSLSNSIAFFRGVIWADICYVPKHQSTPVIALKIAPFFGTKLFTTIEANMCDVSRRNMINSFGTLKKMKKYFSLIPNIYGITNDIINNTNCGIELEKKPLYLGVEKEKFYNNNENRELKNIVFIGSLVKNKVVQEFLKLAISFPNLTFNIVGDGPEKEQLKLLSTPNVIFHDKLNHDDLSVLLRSMNLHFLPSRSEGFPKVVLETASASIPSVLYDTYGASSWISDHVNGFVVSDFNQVESLISELIENPQVLINCSEKSLELASKFDWKNIISNWHEIIDNLR